MKSPQIIGWREWVEFPEWSIRLRAKADTGASSSAIDCAEIIELPGHRVRFTVRLDRKQKKSITLEGEIKHHKQVRSSTGEGQSRIFVVTTVRLAGVEKKIFVNLVSRKSMIHRVLLGREALAGDFLVNSAMEYQVTSRNRPRKQKAQSSE